jgi:transglutaminase-like putative cysteine protease
MTALPHPLAAEQRVVAARDLAWLIASLALAAAPHVWRAPWWLALLTLCLYGWRVYFAINRGPLPSRWLLLGVAAVGAIAVWLGSHTLFGRTPGVQLLMLLSGLKLLETRTQRDAAVCAFLGYFVIITNFLYTQSIATAALACAALFMLTAGLVGFSAPQRPVRENLRSAGLLLAHAAPAALVLFLLFPRVQGPLWGLPRDAYAGLSGLTDSMAPGNISRLALSDAIAFRAEFQGDPPPHRLLYWRALVLWDFDGRTWRPGAPLLAHYEPPRARGRTYRYGIVMEPHNHDWLYSLETATSRPERTHFGPDGEIITASPVRSRLRYELSSAAVADSPRDEAPALLRRALRLPRDLNPRSSALAGKWRENSASDAQIVDKAIGFLRGGGYIYTLEPPPLGENSVDDFLFETKAGFCEHFASAFVFLMRSAGVPARVVLGYQGGDVNPVDRIITVRQSDAHAWAEVFLHGRGWVRIDPTAASAPRRLEDGLAQAVPDANALPFLARTDLEWLRGLRYRWDALAHKWNVWVLGYNPQRQRELLSLVGMPQADWRAMTAILFTILGVLTAMLLGWSLRRLSRPDPVEAAWRKFCRKLAACGLERAPHEGPRDYASRAARALPASRRAILRVGDLYIGLRYGARPRLMRAAVAELRRRVRELTLA